MMNKIHILSAFMMVLAACKSDPIATVQKSKINKDNELTWGQAAEQFSYCQKDSKKWEIIEQRDEGIKFLFTCALTPESIVPLNKNQEQRIDKQNEEEAKSIRERIEYAVKRANDFRKNIRENYTNIELLKQISDEALDELALEFVENRDEYFKKDGKKNPSLATLIATDYRIDSVIWNLGDALRKVSQLNTLLAHKTPYPPAAVEIQYHIELWHWKDPKRIQMQGEFDGSEKINITYADGKTEKALGYAGHHLIHNKNPIAIKLQ